jgi:hypothetical protein
MLARYCVMLPLARDAAYYALARLRDITRDARDWRRLASATRDAAARSQRAIAGPNQQGAGARLLYENQRADDPR